MIPGSANPLLLATAAPTGYNIERSLRFNSSDSAYLSRTPASAGNRRTWTYSCWVKRTGLGTDQALLDASNGSPNDQTRILFGSNNKINFLNIDNNSVLYQLITTAVYRDVSAWMHVVIAVDTTQATASNRQKIYINGSQVTAFDTATYPAQNYETHINRTYAHGIGRSGAYSGFFHLNAYLADPILIDGLQLDPSSFGEFDTNNVWQPKAYTGSYSGNSFRLPFSDNSNNTATTLGKDTSGNGNNWTPNNLSVTAGAGNDSLVDSPTNYGTDTGVGGEVRGSYCTWNPLDRSTNITLANGNLDASNTSAGVSRATHGVLGGKYYFEYQASTLSVFAFGVANGSAGLSQNIASNQDTGLWGLTVDTTTLYRIFNGGTPRTSAARTNTTSDIFQVAVDASNPASVKVWVGVNNTWRDSSMGTTGNPGTGANPTHTITEGVELFPFYAGANASNAVSYNAGARPFAYTAPSGFKALCTANLPSETITTSGSFTGNANADGPFVWLNGVPTAMTINSNSVTFGTHADKLSNGFKLRTNSTSYNTSGSNTYSITTTGAKFKNARAQANP